MVFRAKNKNKIAIPRTNNTMDKCLVSNGIDIPNKPNAIRLLRKIHFNFEELVCTAFGEVKSSI